MHRAQGVGRRMQGASAKSRVLQRVYFFKVLRKAVIILLSLSSLLYTADFSSLVSIFLLTKMHKILAHSNTERLEILRKLANSLSEKEPDPSAILLEILIVAALNCSANLYNLFESAMSA